MKRISNIFLMAVVAIVLPVFDALPPSKAPRLNEISKFPADYEPAVRAVIAAVAKEGMKPSEYFAEISSRDSTLHFWLIHETHDPDPMWRGDSCHKCGTIDYDLRLGSVSRIIGIR
jgi:hypothetical protein